MLKIPNHVAIILDGNGRWAKSKGMPRNYGHTMGAKNVEGVCRAAYDLGIRYLTFYAFSTENWSRPDSEVEAIMNLLKSYLNNCQKIAKKNNMRDEMVRGMKKMTEDVIAGKFGVEDINEEKFASYLDTADIPDPDLLIRTSGEMRLSNYLLWQLAYSEFYFTDTPWPDFHEKELRQAVEAYSSRDRRYGGLKEEGSNV